MTDDVHMVHGTCLIQPPDLASQVLCSGYMQMYGGVSSGKAKMAVLSTIMKSSTV